MSDNDKLRETQGARCRAICFHGRSVHCEFWPELG